ncbi:hypothetical protein [Enterococcus raffinosus]|nr:hypothetical protein [Enterococcus raffinosus]
MIVGIIEKTEVETVLLLLAALGLVVLLVSAQAILAGSVFAVLLF